jgi:hypothetical protein
VTVDVIAVVIERIATVISVLNFDVSGVAAVVVITAAAVAAAVVIVIVVFVVIDDFDATATGPISTLVALADSREQSSMG